MSRIAKWKLEKTKVKVVFRLQFHATHIPQFGWDKLFISFIPADSGKATAKTTKANVRNGACKWADPIYETARLLQDTRTKKYDDKLYKLMVAMGSSRSSILGEANINLADYADALKPSAVALPLNGCEAGTILHVTVQLLTSKTGFREFEQQRELRERGLQTFSDQNIHGESPSGKVSLSDDPMNSHPNKVNARIRSKEARKELPSLDDEVGRKEEYADSATGFDASSNTSESLYAEKHDVHEVDSIKSTVSGDLGGVSIDQSLGSEKGDQGDHQYTAQGSNNWAHNWGSEYAADSDLVAAYKENNRLRESLEVAESSIVELKLEVNSLQNHVDEMGVEMQKIAWQLATETASGTELTEEVSVLKSECLNLKEQLERLKNLQSSLTESIKETLETDQANLYQKLEPQWLKGLLKVEEKIRDLLNKAQFGCQDRDVRFLLAEFEGLLCFLQDIREQMPRAISCVDANPNDDRKLNSPTSQILASGTGFDSDIYHTESMLHCLIPGLVSLEPNSVDAISSMKGKIFELLRELDESKAKQEGLAQKMDQMECYYEAFIQELEENQRQVIGELQSLRNEHATCIYTVTASKDEIEALHHEMNNHLMKFAEDKKNLDSINKELERRALSAETALKRARLNYSIAVNQLQKDLDLLSGQVTSMFETNENLIKHALADSLPSSQEYCEIGWNPKVELEELPAGKLLQCQKRDAGVKEYHSSGGIFSEDLRRSLSLQEGLYQKVEDEVFEVHLVNIYLDVFSKTLQETLLEASSAFKLVKERMNEISQQLELSTKSKELLLLELQASLEEIQSLNDYKTAIVAKYNEMVLKSEILEENLLNVTRENSLLTKKITECEVLVTEYRSFEIKYQTCHMEKLELENSMMEETVESKNLRNEISSLHEQLKELRVEFDNLFSVKDELRNTVDFVQDKLSKLLASCKKNSYNLSISGESVYNDLESDSLASLVLQFENLHLNAYEKLLKLMDENNQLMEERDTFKKSLSRVASDNLIMKENFGNARQDMVNRLDRASGLVQKFQTAIESVSESINSSEAGDKFTQQHKELLSVLDHVEDELQQLTSKNNGLENEMMAMRLVNEELETCKFTIEVLTKEKQALLESLHEKVEESMELKSELGRLEEKSQSLSDELNMEKRFRDSLEKRIKDLDAQIKEKSCKLLDFEKTKADVEDELQQLTSKNNGLENEMTVLRLVNEELETCKFTIEVLTKEKQALLESLHEKVEESMELKSELGCLEEKSQSLFDELNIEKSFRDSLENRIKDLDAQINEKSCKLLDFEKTREDVEDKLQQLTSKNNDLENEMMALRLANEELETCKFTIEVLTKEKQALLESLHEKVEESMELKAELGLLEEKSQSLSDELNMEKSFTDSLEKKIKDLDAQLNEKSCQLLDFEKTKAEVGSLKQLVLDLESEKSRVHKCLIQSEELLTHFDQESSSLVCLESQLSDMHEFSLAGDISLVFTNSQYQDQLENLVQKFLLSERDFISLQEKYLNVETALNHCQVREAYQVEENARLLMSLNSLKADLEAFTSENKMLLDAKEKIMTQSEELQSRTIILEAAADADRSQHAQEVEKLGKELMACEREIDDLLLCKETLEVSLLVVRSKLDEQRANVILLQGMSDEIVTLQNRCNELTQRLSEQILKTEEFKNLSTHLKELKDRANAECLQLREKKENEGTSSPVQESLRIAFIKEQYETKVQELKHQLSVSKKHSEEMLWKLQDAINEVETRKKSEVSHIKRNEELGKTILDLEGKLNAALSEKREITKAYDLVKAEKECSSISLECCKEEKHELEASLKKCNDDRFKITMELNLMKDLLESYKSQTSMHGKYSEDHMSKSSDQDNATPCEEVGCTRSVSADETHNSHAFLNGRGQPEQDVLTSTSVNGLRNISPGNQEDVLHDETKHLAVVNDNFRAQSLKFSMDHLNEELERLKNENLLNDDHPSDSDLPGLEHHLMQLHKANEELGRIFPLFKEFTGSGNALERVLALEIELAEALRAKKKPSMQFQSSFLKQHNDEEAIYRSFRDINELIKDMLDLKGRYTTVETELREMHDRYSQLSLQFAEVEGERQKLMMTVKNVRASRKLLNTNNRSSWSSRGEHSPS